MKKVLLILSSLFLLGCPEKKDDVELSDTELIENEMTELLIEEQELQDSGSGERGIDEDPQAKSLLHNQNEELSTYQWNDLALEAYEEGDYQLATEYCYKAIATDSSYLFAHYNLACMLNLLFRHEEIIDGHILVNGEEIEGYILYHELVICSAIDPSTVGVGADWLENKLRTDSDLNDLDPMLLEGLIKPYSSWKSEVREASDNPEALLDALRERKIGLVTALLAEGIPEGQEAEIIREAARSSSPNLARLVLGWPGLQKEVLSMSEETVEVLKENHPAIYDFYSRQPNLPNEKEAVTQAIESGLQNNETLSPLPCRPNKPLLYSAEIEGEKNMILFEDGLHAETFTALDNEKYTLASAEIMVMSNEDYNIFIQLTENDLGVLGNAAGIDDLEKKVYFLVFDSNMNLLEFHEDPRNWRTVIYSDIKEMEVLSGYPAAVFAVTYNNFVSSWMQQLKVYAIHYQDIDGGHRMDSGEPITIDAEWLGGPDTETEFRNLRFTNRQSVLIDKSENGVVETITLFQLAQ